MPTKLSCNIVLAGIVQINEDLKGLHDPTKSVSNLDRGML